MANIKTATQMLIRDLTEHEMLKTGETTAVHERKKNI